MKIHHQLCIDLEFRCDPPQLYAVQGDNAREMSIMLLSGGEPWILPEDVDVLIRYRNGQGIGGIYDTLPDGTKGWRAEGNILTVSLISQLFAIPGVCQIQVAFLRGEMQLSSFAVSISVEGEVAFQPGTAEYTNLAQWLLRNSNAYFVAVENGFEGTEEQWLQSLVGPKGDKGDTGATGPQGPQGDAFTYDDFTPQQLALLKGEKGDTGATGPKGDKGDKGDTGATGPAGKDGAPGTDGKDGTPGSDAEVTADNIRSALGYTPVSPSQIPTDAHINNLINAALGVIENGTY